ncbi:MAG: DUF4444 domain-containing protein [Rhodobacteraceae bacterium]|nr:DUF4444 domain-containing protein [Paracoccaceae bacterium]
MTLVPSFPPLLSGLAAGPANPMSIAVDMAERGTDSGLLTWSLGDERLRAALVLAPETPLEPAMAAFCICAVGLQNALGVLAPAETAVHLDWAGGIRVNGGHCGGLHVAASTRDPSETPDWLVVGFDLTLAHPAEWEPGETPDWTALDQEGCGEIVPLELLEAWSRHTLVWLNDLEEPGGRARLHREWSGLAWNLGKSVIVPVRGEQMTGTFIGVDENFGMILKTADGTKLVPLTSLIEEV